MALLPAEQKNMLWMNDTILKRTSSVGLVVNCCASTFPVARACMLLPQHGRFAGCELDANCGSLSLAHLTLVFIGKVLNKELDIKGDDKMKQAAFSVARAIVKLGLKHCIRVRKTSASFPTM